MQAGGRRGTASTPAATVREVVLYGVFELSLLPLLLPLLVVLGPQRRDLPRDLCDLVFSFVRPRARCWSGSGVPGAVAPSLGWSWCCRSPPAAPSVGGRRQKLPDPTCRTIGRQPLRLPAALRCTPVRRKRRCGEPDSSPLARQLLGGGAPTDSLGGLESPEAAKVPSLDSWCATVASRALAGTTVGCCGF